MTTNLTNLPNGADRPRRARLKVRVVRKQRSTRFVPGRQMVSAPARAGRRVR